MLETLLVLLLLGLALAKHGKPSGRRYSLRPVRVNASVTLAALAANTAITGTVFGNADGAYRVISVSSTWAWSDHTAGEGPVHVGYAHGDYSVTEIKEFVESSASISIGNKISNEHANRLIRIVGTLAGDTTDETLNDGKPIKTRLNWAIPIGTNLNAFVYSDELQTTGSFIDLKGTAYVKDY